MKPIAIIASVLGVAVVGGVVASPFVVGQGVEATLQKAQEGLSQAIKNQPALAEVVQLKESKYQRGPLSATQELTFSIGCPGTKQETLVLRNSVEHGPLPGFAGLGLAKVRSELVLDATAEATMTKAFGGQKPYLLSSVGFDGRMNSELVVPSGQQDGNSWNEIRATMNFSPNNTQAPADWRVGTINMTSGQDSLLVEGISGSLRTKTDANYPFIGLGEAKVQLSRLEVRGKTPFLLEGMSLSGSNNIAGGAINTSQHWQVKKAVIERQNLSDLQLKMNVADIDAKTYNEMMQTVNKSSQSICNPDPNATGAMGITLLGQVVGFIANPPKLVVEDLSFAMPDGRAKLTGSLEFAPGLDAFAGIDVFANTPDFAALLKAIKATAKIQISEALLKRVINDTGGTMNGFEAQVQAGYITNNGGELSTEIQFENGETRLNGKKL
jgi:uncharacterized protein YdgA (DUF945 family)